VAWVPHILKEKEVRRLHSISTNTTTATTLKSALVDLGLAALSRGEYQIVMAITRLIQRRAMSHV
jgi:hypothetical protein